MGNLGQGEAKQINVLGILGLKGGESELGG